jgi:hypothetical protein
MKVVEYMLTIIGLNFVYLVSFNHAAYTIYFLILLNYLSVLVIDLLTNGFDWSTGGVQEKTEVYFL